MPLWRIFAHPSTFTTDQKRGLSQAITKAYVEGAGLPAFYVNVIFIPLEEDEVWIGGEPRKNFVRIVVEQIARTMVTQERRDFWMDHINKVSTCIDFDEILGE
jgi:phenylpyruvate tautomerase PptA (4-oxalocrotonate tautomerase family)